MSTVGPGGLEPLGEPTPSGASAHGGVGRRGRAAIVVVLVVFAALVALPFLLRSHDDDVDGSLGTGRGRTGLLALAGGKNVVGNDPGTRTGVLWAAISGPHTRYQDGDPFAAKCLGERNIGLGEDGCGGAGPNPEYRPEGYLYGIDVGADAVGSTLTVSLFDAGHYDRTQGRGSAGAARQSPDFDTSQFPYAEPQDQTQGSSGASPDRPTGTEIVDGPSSGVTTSFEVFAPGGALDGTDGPSLGGMCTEGPGQLVVPPETDAARYKNRWATLCTVSVAKAGVYHVRVKSSAIPRYEDAGAGWNQYLVRATTTAGASSVFALGDISIFMTNSLNGSAVDYPLAAVPAIYAGHHLRVRLFDPGDGSGAGAAFVRVAGPGDAESPCVAGPEGQPAQAYPTCRFPTRSAGSSVGMYNGRWVIIDVDLPADYSCAADCTWRIRFDWGASQATDRATWEASITDAAPDLPVVGTVVPDTSPGRVTTPGRVGTMPPGTRPGVPGTAPGVQQPGTSLSQPRSVPAVTVTP